MKSVRFGNEKVLLGLLLVLCISSGVYLSNYLIVSAADSVSRTARVTVASACTLSTDSGGTPHTAVIINGIYSGSMSEHSSGIGLTNLLASCNDSGGFSIYAVGYSNDTYGETDLIADNVNNTNIATGTATNGPTSAWAMKLANNGASAPSITSAYTVFHAVPDNYDKVATHNAATTTNDGLALTTTYATYISPTQMAGSYSGKVKYTLVHPASEVPAQPQTPTARCINYFANASNAVGTMGCQSATDNASVTLLASNFSRVGYGFAGWSDAYDYATNPNAHFYGPQETITAPVGTTANGLSLYAVWVKSEGSLQNQSKVAALCGTSPTTGSLTIAPTNGTANLSSVSALTDSRDNQTYAIARLADGKCWMIENLRLEADNTRTAEKQALAQGYGKYSGTGTNYGNFAGLANAESANFSNSTTANSIYYSGTQSDDATIDIGTSNNPGYRMPRYNNWNNQSTSANRPQNPTSNSATNSTTNAGMYSYGNYYTWHAAIADLTYNGTNNQSTTGTSLCPTGWHLPTGGLAYASGSTSGVNVTGDTSTFREFYNLGYKTMDEVKTAYEDTPNSGYAYYSSNTTNTAGKTATAAFRSFPNNFLYSGYFTSSSALLRGSYGYYWSSTASNGSESYNLNLYSSRVYPGTNGSNKFVGFSFRCVSGS